MFFCLNISNYLNNVKRRFIEVTWCKNVFLFSLKQNLILFNSVERLCQRIRMLLCAHGLHVISDIFFSVSFIWLIDETIFSREPNVRMLNLTHYFHYVTPCDSYLINSGFEVCIELENNNNHVTIKDAVLFASISTIIRFF